MSVLIIPEPLNSKLAAYNAPVELCANDGRVLGYFTPAKARTINLDPGISEDELSRREQEGGGRVLADVFKEWGVRS